MEIKIVFDNKQFVDKLINIAENLRSKYQNTLPYNCGYYHENGYYTWDCWNLIKSLVWGWEDERYVGYYCFEPNKNGMGDWNGRQILEACSEVSTDFTYVPMGAYLLNENGSHAGIYIGEHEYGGFIFNVVECTPAWMGGVQLSYVDTLGRRKQNKYATKLFGSWKYHGLLPWVEYKYKNEKDEKRKKKKEEKLKLVQKNYCSLYLKLAQEIIDGKWGNGAQRRKALNSCGYDYKYAQSLVDVKLEE